MHKFDEMIMRKSFVVSGELVELSNHEQTLRMAQGERDDDYDDEEEDEDEEREWCD